VQLAELADAPPTIPFLDGARLLGYRRTAAYEAARSGHFPVPVIKLGPGRWVIPTAALLQLLDGHDPP
jgi:hypothetical protein